MLHSIKIVCLYFKKFPGYVEVVGIMGKKQWWVLQQYNCKRSLGILERTHAFFTKYWNLFINENKRTKNLKKFLSTFHYLKIHEKKKSWWGGYPKRWSILAFHEVCHGHFNGDYFVYQSFDKVVQFQPLG